MADSVKVSRFSNARKNTLKFFREIKSELKKVIWPSRQQLINNTVTVLLSCLVVGAIIWVIDAGLLAVTEILFIK